MSDLLATNEFSLLLRTFNKLVDNQPPIEQIKGQLLEIKEAAKLSNELTYRQKDAVIERCNNYLNGVYNAGKRKLQGN